MFIGTAMFGVRLARVTERVLFRARRLGYIRCVMFRYERCDGLTASLVSPSALSLGQVWTQGSLTSSVSLIGGSF